MQRVIVNISERGMEEAGANVTRCIDHSGDPRRITTRCDVLCLAKVGTEVEHDASQLAG